MLVPYTSNQAMSGKLSPSCCSGYIRRYTDTLILLILALGESGSLSQWRSLKLMQLILTPDAMSYLSHSPATVLASAKAEKKRKYRAASSDCRVTFTLLCLFD